MGVKINIEGLLQKKKIKLSDLEKLVNLSYQQLWNIKEGRTTKISFDTIGQLLNAFKCKPNDLFIIENKYDGYGLMILRNKKNKLLLDLEETEDKEEKIFIKKEIKKIEKDISRIENKIKLFKN